MHEHFFMYILRYNLQHRKILNLSQNILYIYGISPRYNSTFFAMEVLTFNYFIIY